MKRKICMYKCINWLKLSNSLLVKLRHFFHRISYWVKKVNVDNKIKFLFVTPPRETDDLSFTKCGKYVYNQLKISKPLQRNRESVASHSCWKKRYNSSSNLKGIFGLLCLETEAIWHSQKSTVRDPTRGLLPREVREILQSSRNALRGGKLRQP